MGKTSETSTRIGTAILNERNRKSMRQIALAEMLGVPAKVVSQWERNKSLPTQEQIEALKEIFPRLNEVPTEPIPAPLLPEDILYQFTQLDVKNQAVIRAAFVAMVEALSE